MKDVEQGNVAGSSSSDDESVQCSEKGVAEHSHENEERPNNGNVSSYLKGSDFREIIYCLIFLVLCNIVFMVPQNVRKRPIPYQLLDSTGEYVLNQVNAEHEQDIIVNNALLVVLGIIVPFSLQIILSKTRFGRRGDTHSALCVYFVSLGITLLVTELVKLFCGYLRPIFYEVCKPNATFDECTEEEHTLDARKSFPSGHSSLCFCGLTILTLYQSRRFGVTSIRVCKQRVLTDGTIQKNTGFKTVRRDVVTLYRFISVLSLWPMAIAVFVAASQVAVNKHFPADVVGGAVLGTAVPLYINGIWYDDLD